MSDFMLADWPNLMYKQRGNGYCFSIQANKFNFKTFAVAMNQDNSAQVALF